MKTRKDLSIIPPPLIDSRPLDRHDIETTRSYPVTICIAALCHKFNESYIIFTTDHQLTTADGDVAFEPPVAKYYGKRTDQKVALVAGDLAAQVEICSRVWGKRKPDTIGQTVRAYAQELGRFNLDNAERKVLFPVNVSAKSFLANPQIVPDWVSVDFHDKLNHDKAEVSTIICGFDHIGPHLYTIDKHGGMRQQTSIGFTAIGEGARHALSQFMFAKYTTEWPPERALPLLYAAKKRAEVAPGVGEATGMFIISRPNGLFQLNDSLVVLLETQYEQMLNAQRTTEQQAEEVIAEFLSRGPDTTSESQPQQPSDPTSEPNRPSDSTEPNQKPTVPPAAQQ